MNWRYLNSFLDITKLEYVKTACHIDDIYWASSSCGMTDLGIVFDEEKNESGARIVPIDVPHS